MAKILATDIVRKIALANPRRRGSKGYKLWDMYVSGETVGVIESRWDAYRATLTAEEARKAGAVRNHLKWDIDKGDIQIGPAEDAPMERPNASNSRSMIAPALEPITLTEAKARLGIAFGVPPSAIEITIRG